MIAELVWCALNTSTPATLTPSRLEKKRNNKWIASWS
jgi:hypothetical protein